MQPVSGATIPTEGAKPKALPSLLRDLESSITAEPEFNLSQQVIRSLVHAPGSALSMGAKDCPVLGQTTCLGSLPLALEYGDFKVYAFTTTAFAGRHVLAITKGDVSTEEPLLIRMHSECITSETLRGCDCDCVEQLNGALKKIAEEGRGVLFYIRQEGRGAGYDKKGRDRMAVAASDEKLGTFEVYEAMGLSPDPRSYEFMPDMVGLLGITAPVKVMTNNPHKIEGIESSGLRIAERCPLVVPANPFNLYYLQTKSSSGGHMFHYDSSSQPQYPWPVEVFKPYVLQSPGAMRFVHMASYPLPVRPMDGVMVLEEGHVHELLDIVGDQSKVKLQKLSYNEHFKVTLDPELLSTARNSDSPLTGFIGRHPYWFNDHVYHDRIAHLDFVALVYNQNPDAIPAVRVQSENLLQRLPLRAEDRSMKYQRAIQEIVDNGRGMLLLYPEDGRGKGFSALFLEQSLVDQGIAKDNAEAVELLGCHDEMRDFRSLATLIRHHYPEQQIKLLLGTAGSGSVAGLKAHGIEIAQTVLLGSR